MKKLLFSSLLLLFFLSHAEANFFTDLFNMADEKKDTQFKEVEEEGSTIEEYYDSAIEPQATQEKVFSDDMGSDKTEEDLSFIKSKNIFLSYTKAPKKVYINQHFIITIKAIITAPDIKSIATRFLGGNAYQILNPNAQWKKIGDKSYQNSYILKFTSAKSSLPNIRVSARSARGEKSSEILQAYAQKRIALKKSDYFCLVLAKDFTLLSHHEKQYDDKHTIISLEINATEANLEDFTLPFALRQGIDTIKQKHNTTYIYYFAILPSYQKELKFKYFNLNSNKFNRISFPIVVSDNSISTQTNLNPQKSKYFFYKVIALLSLALLFILLYTKYKKGYLLFFAMVIAIYTIYTKLISNNLTLHKDMLIRILPTQNSTIFLKTASDMEVKVLLKKNGYTKVLLPNTKIGWIKDDDL